MSRFAHFLLLSLCSWNSSVLWGSVHETWIGSWKAMGIGMGYIVDKGHPQSCRHPSEYGDRSMIHVFRSLPGLVSGLRRRQAGRDRHLLVVILMLRGGRKQVGE
jgi:hypothetical protein